MSNQFTLVYGTERVPYSVNPDPKRTTRIAIHVEPNGMVQVDAPPDFPEQAVQKAVQKRARWVVDHVAEARQRYAHVSPREYVSGEQILYLGRRYVLKVIIIQGGRTSVKLKANRLEVITRSSDPDDIRGRVRGWYRAKARDYFCRRLDELSIKLPWVEAVPPFKLQEMTRQWGSCSPSGQIILNPHLIKAPRECIEYVLVHELAHLKHHHHGAQFWALIDRQLPGWEQPKAVLDNMVELLHNG
ncbi:M48 family metallopeptidase [uncultured Roseobacter sp.]|uniref:M48 family metallopeptidase n=1 Tax=uncultured Roseobacter sp. TaxID=114847 RepID=UPI00260A66E2|nr:SprT family zinc-dependent metalloprotease [uncultured Roseobacter sp.]